ncbi:hypothetical protein [Caldithrix abyssi]|uniref:Looped-hinge helix DNA binding domain-containing protein, AbrB family n=1 Tax=Caldithrix abyssi DSM 13497 TaxID=880073 RepID=H1XTA4_CALAY|nr:hypothetical protein [Caldithrix abyssi]APF18687.1 looped-hinge helix DNA binding domain-containing protein, AbrB family [Caldithrix abyssi DSM 13497]EHO42671.1 hypothetical protein Calab_3065 [Caldithrix abyssi DSM 13497]
MLTGTFIAQLKEKNRIEIPAEILTKLDLKEGDKIEVSLKRIRPGKLGIRIARNPLSKLLELAREREKR